MSDVSKCMNLREVLAELPQNEFLDIFIGDEKICTGTPRGIDRQRWVRRPDGHFVEEVARNGHGRVRIVLADNYMGGE